MFIRKKVKMLKNGKESVIYYAVKNFKKDEKTVIKETISLGQFPTLEIALSENLRYLAKMEECLARPFSEYEKAVIVGGIDFVTVPMPLKEVEKKKEKIVEMRDKLKVKVDKFKSFQTEESPK